MTDTPVVMPAETCDEMVRLLKEALHSLEPAEAAPAYSQVFSVLIALETVLKDPGTEVRLTAPSAHRCRRLGQQVTHRR